MWKCRRVNHDRNAKRVLIPLSLKIKNNNNNKYLAGNLDHEKLILWGYLHHFLSEVSNFFAAFLVWREVEAGLMEYKPDIIISVHPLMQHIPLWVLKWQGLQKKVVFVTVITDLNTCHPTWLVSKLLFDYLFSTNACWSFNFLSNIWTLKIQVSSWCKQMLLRIRGSSQESLAWRHGRVPSSCLWPTHQAVLRSSSTPEGRSLHFNAAQHM